MKTIIMGAQAIKSGDANIFVAGGMENMSLAPHLLLNSRTGLKFGSGEIRDAMSWDGLQDVYTNRPMGNCAEECVEKYSLLEEQDNFSIESFKRAQAAIEEEFSKMKLLLLE